ncbi:MAG: YeeE/YedE family protein [Bacteriovoracia bacterium]
MTNINSVLNGLLGGAVIGLAVTVMLLFNGRVTGISGIVAASLARPSQGIIWRWMFVGGLVAGGAFMFHVDPAYFDNQSGRSGWSIALAGLLVGYGTVLGSGCTSGHGICGLSRFSFRSLVATLTFMAFGFLSVQIMRALLGDQG